MTNEMSGAGAGQDEFLATARALLLRAVEERVTPGAIMQVSTSAEVLPQVVVGKRSYGGASVESDTAYDLASLTKVVACLPLLLNLLEAGEIDLDHTVEHYFSNAGWFQESRSLAAVTVEELALHSSGLPAWTPLFAWVSDRRTATANVLQTALSGERGSYDYSDLGVMILGAIIERVSGERLDAIARRLVYEPLAMAATGYGPLAPGANVAATEDDGWRGRLLQGEVHDENAWTMDGVSAHAGLFGTAADLTRYARAWLAGDAPFCSAEWLAEATRDRSRGQGPARGLLWRLNSDTWPIGAKLGSTAYGHTGFTGTSLVIEPEQGWTCVLLTNRVHPRRGSSEGVIKLRREIHALVAETFGTGGQAGDIRGRRAAS